LERINDQAKIMIVIIIAPISPFKIDAGLGKKYWSTGLDQLVGNMDFLLVSPPLVEVLFRIL
jgi:hypothetical protein